jgi:hypothetical protein
MTNVAPTAIGVLTKRGYCRRVATPSPTCTSNSGQRALGHAWRDAAGQDRVDPGSTVRRQHQQIGVGSPTAREHRRNCVATQHLGGHREAASPALCRHLIQVVAPTLLGQVEYRTHRPGQQHASRGALAILRRRKRCMITWPAIVPTVADDRPDASNEIPKTQLDAGPSSGVSVRCASSSVPISLRPARKKVDAAMINMAMLISPASPMAIATSMISKRNSRRSCCGSRVTMRPCVRAEWR